LFAFVELLLEFLPELPFEVAGVTDDFAFGGSFFRTPPVFVAVLALAESLNPPAIANTHIAPYSGCGPQEMPTTL